nr:rhodanese-like domain-containing protein [Edwardsiella ictaluri]
MKPVLPLVAGVMLAALSALPAQAGLFSPSEVDAEKQAVQLARETASGKYQLLTVQELKQWMGEKKPMLIVDTMPFADSYKKQHIPGALNMAFPMGDMTVWDKASMGAITQADFMRMLGAIRIGCWYSTAVLLSALVHIMQPCGPERWATGMSIACQAGLPPGKRLVIR